MTIYKTTNKYFLIINKKLINLTIEKAKDTYNLRRNKYQITNTQQHFSSLKYSVKCSILELTFDTLANLFSCSVMNRIYQSRVGRNKIEGEQFAVSMLGTNIKLSISPSIHLTVSFPLPIQTKPNYRKHTAPCIHPTLIILSY